MDRWRLLFAIFGLALFQTLFSGLRAHVATALSMRLRYRLHLSYLDHLLRLPAARLETRLPGDLLSRFGDLAQIEGTLRNLVVSLPPSLLTLLLSFGLLFNYNPRIALVALLVLPIHLLYLWLLAPRLRENNRQQLVKGAQVNSFVLGSLEGIATLKALRGESWALLRGREQVSGLNDLAWQGFLLSNWGGAAVGLLSSAFSLFLLWYGAGLVLAQSLALGALSGVLQPRGEPVQVLSPGSGRLVRYRLSPNRRVQEGELLLELDTLGLGPQEARAQLQAAEAQVEEARRALAQQRETLSQRMRLARLQAELYAAGGVARLTAQAQLATLRTRRSLKVHSPARGQVLQAASLRAGEWVSTGQPLGQILPHDVPLVFRGYVPERERPKLREGAPAEVAWNAYPRQRFGLSRGRVTRISPGTLIKNNTLVYEIEIALDSLKLTSPEGTRELLPGLAGEARAIAA